MVSPPYIFELQSTKTHKATQHTSAFTRSNEIRLKYRIAPMNTGIKNSVPVSDKNFIREHINRYTILNASRTFATQP